MWTSFIPLANVKAGGGLGGKVSPSCVTGACVSGVVLLDPCRPQLVKALRSLAENFARAGVVEATPDWSCVEGCGVADPVFPALDFERLIIEMRRLDYKKYYKYSWVKTLIYGRTENSHLSLGVL